ncbi:hypothetical protein ACL90Y_08780 [Micrococcus luteus]
MTRIHRTARAAALSAAALLALTACAGESQETEENTAGQSAEQSAAGQSEGGQAEAPKAEEVSYAAGDCLTNEPGARDVGTFEKVDCEQEHNAEYLWAVPEKDEDDTTDTEAVCRAAGSKAGEDLEVTVSATELRNSADGTQHCLVYALAEGWEGQIVDPSTTLEDAQAEADA